VHPSWDETVVRGFQYDTMIRVIICNEDAGSYYLSLLLLLIMLTLSFPIAPYCCIVDIDDVELHVIQTNEI